MSRREGQPGLFNPVNIAAPTIGRSRRNNPETSKKAAREIAPITGKQRIRVLRMIVDAGAYGLTDAEGREMSGLQVGSQGTRRKELQEAGMVRDSGTTRPTPSGKDAIVWIATNEGTQAIALIDNPGDER